MPPPAPPPAPPRLLRNFFAGWPDVLYRYLLQLSQTIGGLASGVYNSAVAPIEGATGVQIVADAGNIEQSAPAGAITRAAQIGFADVATNASGTALASRRANGQAALISDSVISTAGAATSTRSAEAVGGPAVADTSARSLSAAATADTSVTSTVTTASSSVTVVGTTNAYCNRQVNGNISQANTTSSGQSSAQANVSAVSGGGIATALLTATGVNTSVAGMRSLAVGHSGEARVETEIVAAGAQFRISTSVGAGLLTRLTLDPNGRLLIGPGTPAARRIFEVTSTTEGACPWPSMDTTQENALAAACGIADVRLTIFNVNLGEVRYFIWDVTTNTGCFTNGQIKGQWSAGASLTTAGTQYIPAGAATTSATSLGGVVQQTGSICTLLYSYVGDAANGGQTATITLERSVGGGAFAAVPGATSGAVATTAGQKAARIFFGKFAVTEGDLLRPVITVSAGLAVALDNVAVSVE